MRRRTQRTRVLNARSVVQVRPQKSIAVENGRHISICGHVFHTWISKPMVRAMLSAFVSKLLQAAMVLSFAAHLTCAARLHAGELL